MTAPATNRSLLGGPFGEADLEADQLGSELGGCTYPPPAGWEEDFDAAVVAELRDTSPGTFTPAEPARESSIRDLLEPPQALGKQRDTSPEPGSIEDALLRAAESRPTREPASQRRLRFKR